MDKFCDNCEGILEYNTEGNNLVFECPKCRKKYDLEDRHTLLYTDYINNLKHTASATEQLLKHAVYDRTNMKILEKCDKCDRIYKTLIRIGENEEIHKMCVCKYS